MEQENAKIYGEFGELLETFVTNVKPEDKNVHVSVGITIDGYTINEDGTTTIVLTPKDAKELSEQLVKAAEIAYEDNFKILKI